jgi:hypothetical protein
MSQTKQAREDMFVGITTDNINSTTAYNEHTTLTSMASDATSLIIPSGSYTHVRIHPLLLSFATSAGFRVTGWSKLGNNYYPTLLFVGSIAGVQASTMITNNSVALKGVHGITATAGMGANTLINNAAVLSVASIVVPVFGCSHVEVDFISATATAAYANILYNYCSIG